MPVIGFLQQCGGCAVRRTCVDAFRQGLNEAGYRRGPERRDRISLGGRSIRSAAGLAADLVRRQVAVIVDEPALRRRPPRRRPRQFRSSSRLAPTRSEPASSPASTGRAAMSRASAFTTTDLVAKRLELLHELVPTAAVIAVLVNPNHPDVGVQLREAEAAGRALGRQILIVNASK